LLITNNLDVAAVHCRVLLTAPLESFVMGRTIVVSRGLLDVLPDEATLAAVLSHELAHIVLQHTVGNEYLTGLASSVSDLEIFEHLNFRFDPAKEADADKKGLELFSNSPYKDQLGDASLFLEALKRARRNYPTCCTGASATTLRKVIWSGCRR
jgi:Peptidase family M48